MDSESNLQQYRGKVLFVDDAKVNLMLGRKSAVWPPPL